MQHTKVMSCLTKMAIDIEESTVLLKESLEQLRNLSTFEPHNNKLIKLINNIENQINNNLNK
jgi:hypothetical protein